MNTNPTWSLLLLVALLTGCFDRGEPVVTGVNGQLTVGPGVVFIEEGPLYEGVFTRATLIDADGNFELELTTTGAHGFHAYVEGYIYLPLEIEVFDGEVTRVTQSLVDWDYLCDVGGNCDWVEQPSETDVLTPGDDMDLGDNPTIMDPHVVQVAPGIVQLTVDVFDPGGDLSNQILAHDIATGIGVKLNPPGPVVDGNYPNGVYTATTYLPAGATATGPWQFVAADHACSNSDILEVIVE